MSLLNARLRTIIQRAVLRALHDTCDIYTDAISTSTDGLGGQVVTETLVKSGVACRVVAASNSLASTAKLVGEQVALTDLYELAVPVGTGIAINHKIVTGGHKYNVIADVENLTDDMLETVIVSRQE